MGNHLTLTCCNVCEVSQENEHLDKTSIDPQIEKPKSDTKIQSLTKNGDDQNDKPDPIFAKSLSEKNEFDRDISIYQSLHGHAVSISIPIEGTSLNMKSNDETNNPISRSNYRDRASTFFSYFNRKYNTTRTTFKSNITNNQAPMKYVTHSDAVIIACYFNPSNSQHYKTTFLNFYESIKHCNHRLIECILGEDNEDRSSYALPVNDLNIKHIHTKTLLWHNECLLNILIKELPSQYKYVFWLTGDIKFTNMNWITDSVAMLKSGKCTVLQPYEQVIFLDGYESVPSALALEQIGDPCSRNIRPRESRRVWKSHAYNFNKKRNFDSLDFDTHGHVGFAWGIQRKVLDECGGLYDRALAGGGDHIMAHAITQTIGYYDDHTVMVQDLHKCVSRLHTDQDELAHITSWSYKFHKYCNEQFNYISGDIYHFTETVNLSTIPGSYTHSESKAIENNEMLSHELTNNILPTLYEDIHHTPNATTTTTDRTSLTLQAINPVVNTSPTISSSADSDTAGCSSYSYNEDIDWKDKIFYKKRIRALSPYIKLIDDKVNGLYETKNPQILKIMHNFFIPSSTSSKINNSDKILLGNVKGIDVEKHNHIFISASSFGISHSKYSEMSNISDEERQLNQVKVLPNLLPRSSVVSSISQSLSHSLSRSINALDSSNEAIYPPHIESLENSTFTFQESTAVDTDDEEEEDGDKKDRNIVIPVMKIPMNSVVYTNNANTNINTNNRSNALNNFNDRNSPEKSFFGIDGTNLYDEGNTVNNISRDSLMAAKEISSKSSKKQVIFCDPITSPSSASVSLDRPNLLSSGTDSESSKNINTMLLRRQSSMGFHSRHNSMCSLYGSKDDTDLELIMRRQSSLGYDNLTSDVNMNVEQNNETKDIFLRRQSALGFYSVDDYEIELLRRQSTMGYQISPKYFRSSSSSSNDDVSEPDFIRCQSAYGLGTSQSSVTWTAKTNSGENNSRHNSFDSLTFSPMGETSSSGQFFRSPNKDSKPEQQQSPSKPQPLLTPVHEDDEKSSIYTGSPPGGSSSSSHHSGSFTINTHTSSPGSRSSLHNSNTSSAKRLFPAVED